MGQTPEATRKEEEVEVEAREAQVRQLQRIKSSYFWGSISMTALLVTLVLWGVCRRRRRWRPRWRTSSRRRR